MTRANTLKSQVFRKFDLFIPWSRVTRTLVPKQERRLAENPPFPSHEALYVCVFPLPGFSTEADLLVVSYCWFSDQNFKVIYDMYIYVKSDWWLVWYIGWVFVWNPVLRCKHAINVFLSQYDLNKFRTAAGRNPASELGSCVPFLTEHLYIPGGAIFLPSTAIRLSRILHLTSTWKRYSNNNSTTTMFSSTPHIEWVTMQVYNCWNSPGLHSGHALG